MLSLILSEFWFFEHTQVASKLAGLGQISYV
jgi:hypothetical protein